MNNEDIGESEIVEDVKDDNYIEAQKFIGLIEAFDTSTKGLEDNLVQQKESTLKDLEIVDDIPEELNMSLIESDELLNDFILVRGALRDDISSTRVLLKKLSEDMASTNGDDISSSLVASYAELKKGSVASMKLLMDSYSSVAETQLKIKKLVQEIKTIENKESNEVGGTTNIQNNFTIGTTADILKSLKG